MKYKVIKDCHGFKNRYWKKDTVIELSDEDTPPKWFEPVGGNVEEEKEPLLEPVAISQLQQGRNPKGGLAQSLEETHPEVDNKTLQPKKRGRPKKDS